MLAALLVLYWLQLRRHLSLSLVLSVSKINYLLKTEVGLGSVQHKMELLFSTIWKLNSFWNTPKLHLSFFAVTLIPLVHPKVNRRLF